MFGSKFSDEVRIYVDEMELYGIQSHNISYNAPNQIIKYLGYNNGTTVLGGPISQKVSLSKILVSTDPLINYSGNLPFRGSVNYGGISYGFLSGYLENYSINCAIGAIPKVSANFIIADEMKTGVSAEGAIPHPEIDIPTQGSISIMCDKSTSQRVVGFDYAFNVKRFIHYSIGSTLPKHIEYIAPIEYTATVQIDLDDGFLENSYQFLTNRQNRNISFAISGRNGNNIQTFTIPNASLIGEQLDVGAGGAVKLTLNYIGHHE